MPEKPKNSTATATAKPPASPSPSAPPAAATSTNAATSANATETAKRTRTSFSKEKKIGYMLLSILKILNSDKVGAILSEEQKALVAKANTAAKDIGAEDPFKAVNDRVTAIQKELVELQGSFPKDITDNAAMTKYVASVKELSQELDRQLKRKAQITELLGK